MDLEASCQLKRLRDEQRRLADRVILYDDFDLKDIDRICGIDVAYQDEIAFCVLAVFDFGSKDLIEVKTAKTCVSFPYIPTSLSFREFDAMKKLAKNLNSERVVLFVDGNGILHPRKLGLASYLGIKLDLITIGVAKSPLCGELIGTPKKVGDFSEIKYDNETRGYGMKTSKSKKLVYISSGHRISPKTSLAFAKTFTSKRIPEPLRIADINSKKYRLAKLKKEKK